MVNIQDEDSPLTSPNTPRNDNLANDGGISLHGVDNVFHNLF